MARSKEAKAHLVAKPTALSEPRDTWSERTKAVHLVARLMLSGQWIEGKTMAELGPTLGYSESTMAQVQSEAGRLCAILSDVDTLENIARSRLLEIAGEDSPDRVAAIKVLFDSLGKAGRGNGLNSTPEKLAEARRLCEAHFRERNGE